MSLKTDELGISKRKPPRSLDCIWPRLPMPPSSAWTKRAPSRPSTGSIPCCRSPGRAERHGFEYFRHGTRSLYSALETSSGQLIGSTASRHPSQEFVRFLQEVVATQPSGKEIHLIVDNLSAHKTKLVERFLADHPKLSLHYTPTYRSWLHQVENWFSKVQRHVMPVESSHPWPTCVANSCATSKPTIRLPLPFDGPTRTQPIESQRSCFI